jgi:hypothetical protein
VNDVLLHEQPLRQKVATVQIAAVHPDELDLAGLVRALYIPGWRQARAAEVDDHRVLVRTEASPLALHSHQLIADLEDKVCAAMLGYWGEDGHAGLDRGELDRCFGNCAFEVRVVTHEQMFPCGPDGLTVSRGRRI